MNSYAVAQSAAIADESDAQGRQAFPVGIWWTSWKTPALRNVFFATDFSPASGAALPYAISIARHYRANLQVAHITTPDVSGLIAPQLIDRMRSDWKAGAAERIEELIRSARAEDIKYEPIVGEGAVADALLGTVRTKDIDLVVLGTHGRRGFRKLVLGSVAEVPVLTVR